MVLKLRFLCDTCLCSACVVEIHKNCNIKISILNMNQFESPIKKALHILVVCMSGMISLFEYFKMCCSSVLVR